MVILDILEILSGPIALFFACTMLVFYLGHLGNCFWRSWWFGPAWMVLWLFIIVPLILLGVYLTGLGIFQMFKGF